MRTRSNNPFSTVTTSGLLLPIDLLVRIADGDPDLKGLKAKDYHLRSGERLNEAAALAWSQCLSAWKSFRKRFNALPASDIGTTTTRDEWLLPLFQELGYGRLQTKKALDFDGTEYPISHGWEDHVPIHLLSARLPLDRRTAGVSGAAARAPYSLLQELLNRSSTHRWGFVSNGLKLYLLRDNAALARAANVEFDLEAMMDGEVYYDFFLLFCLCHQSRVEIRGAGSSGPVSGKQNSDTQSPTPDTRSPEDCWLEDWANQADQQGTRAREKLRDGVETSIKSLGAGFLTTKGNDALRAKLRSGELSTQDYYRQLLRLVYRILMLLVAEEKRSESGDNLLHPPGTSLEVRDRYARYYSVGRVRSLAYERRGTAHTDLYESLKVLFLKLRTGYEPLGIPGMGSFLFSEDATPDLDDACMANQDLLDAFRNLCYTDDTSARGGGIRRPVDFGNLGSEELGSVYESLLELHPLIDTDEGPFTLGTAAGHERKTTGSYYTPTSLINCLLDSALDPVVHEAINVPNPVEAERKLLDLKVCDPACGSGHFLIAAADRMAMHLARIRTGDDQPNTIDIQHAKRDIIGRCIYGVDINPMAVELCKVSLWMEALEPGKPLSFLDHHIQCGNSLIGTTPTLLAEGIPDDAFKPIEGDDPHVCKELKKRNKREREDYKSGQGYLFEPIFKLGNLTDEFAKLTAAEDDSLDSIAAKRKKYAELVKGASYQNARLWADTLCAAFVWKKVDSDLGWLCPTERKYRDIERNPHNVNPGVRAEIERLAGPPDKGGYQFFHWHIAFPDVFIFSDTDSGPDNQAVGWSRGFDVILGNPPWDRVKLQEKEWFAERDPRIANARNASARRKMIASLSETQPILHREFKEAIRSAEGVSFLLRHSGRYPLCGRGDVNLYTVFAELMRTIASNSGRVGAIVPSGLSTDDTTKHFFSELMKTRSLLSLYDFENRQLIFTEVAPVMRFSLVTMGNGVRPLCDKAYFAFFLTQTTELNENTKTFELSHSDLVRLSPNTGNCPTFRSRKEAELGKLIYTQHPVLLKDGAKQENPWNVKYFTMFHMANDSSLFITRKELEATATCVDGNYYSVDRTVYYPLYEGKLLNQFDHRAGTFAGRETEAIFNAKASTTTSSESDKANPQYAVIPRYWVREADISRKTPEAWSHSWLLAFREVIQPMTNARCSIFSVLPRSGLSHKLPGLLPIGIAPSHTLSLIANLNSFIFDFLTRQKIGGASFSLFILKQLAIVEPKILQSVVRWDQARVGYSWMASRSIELSFPSWDLNSFAVDCNYDGPPFRWDNDRRFEIRCELDAAYFHLYLGSKEKWGADNPTLLEMFPSPRHAVDYIMDTFPIVRRKDEAKYDGEYRTKTTILKIYDEMAEVMRANDAVRAANPGKTDAEAQSQFTSYKSPLNPPPGPPTDANGNFIPMAQWDPNNWPSHIHPPREAEVTP